MLTSVEFKGLKPFPREALRLLPRPDFLFFRRFDFVQLLEREVAVADFLVGGAKTGIARRFGARAEQDHVFIAGVVELIKLSRWNSHEHAGIERARRRVGKMKRALALDAVELLVGGVLVHRPLGAGIISVHPGVKLIRGEQHFFAVADFELGLLCRR